MAWWPMACAQPELPDRRVRQPTVTTDLRERSPVAVPPAAPLAGDVGVNGKGDKAEETKEILAMTMAMGSGASTGSVGAGFLD